MPVCPIKFRAAVSALCAATVVSAAGPVAKAADLDAPPPYAQDDEDYAPPRVWRQPDPDAPYGRTPYGRTPPPPPPPRYAERYDDPGCLPRWRIRERLAGQGWVDVEPVGRDGSIVTLEARREESGRRFYLEVDRCSGAIVDSRPARHAFGMDRRWRGPY